MAMGSVNLINLPELDKVTHDESAPLCLDLSGLRLADSEGIAALLRLQKAGAVMRGASPYLKLLLHGAPHPRETGSLP